MEQFSLEEWLKNKSRKVVTRSGNPVRIVCWDLPGEYKILAIIDEKPDGSYTVLNKKCDGTGGVSTSNLFFADEEKTNKILDELKSYLKNTPKEQVEKDWKEIQDWYNHYFTNEEHNEEEELTEFEKAIRNILVRYISNVDDFPETIKSEAKALLDLARKELKKKFVLLAKEDYQTAFDLGKAEILKNFSKWKKCVGSTGPFIDDFRGEDYLYLKDYVIKVSELFEKLPKEE